MVRRLLLGGAALLVCCLGAIAPDIGHLPEIFTGQTRLAVALHSAVCAYILAGVAVASVAGLIAERLLRR